MASHSKDVSVPLPEESAQSIVPTTLSTELLEIALLEAIDRGKQLRSRLLNLQQELGANDEEERILSRLMALRRGEPEYAATKTQIDRREEVSPLFSQTSRGHGVIEAVVAILAGAKRPVHISELMRLLGERSVTIPGSGTQANLISYLRRDNQIVRPSRGMYGLAVWGLVEMPRSSKKGRKNRRRKRILRNTN